MYDIAAQLWLGGVSHTVLLFLAIAIVGIITVRWIMAQLRGCQKQATDAQKVRNRGESEQIYMLVFNYQWRSGRRGFGRYTLLLNIHISINDSTLASVCYRVIYMVRVGVRVRLGLV